ncbi:hypothetical protein [Paracoccus sanguinis]|uniref:Outer membrane protein assembly factor BamE n=1 Tax=Paracoccus sanguinis TaxID=1545044 RepID=A0A1H3ALI6_9RHOB|nr:hypothetical protein [Paracoccus sanguinis]SDX30465.1 hypothetical protein SAMN05444276_104125 [Paracoccus sanguinis]
MAKTSLAIAASLLALSLESAGAMSPTPPTETPATATATATTGTATTFDRAAWVAVAGKADQSEPRFALIEAAIAEIPPGTPRDEVRARLGEPDQSFPDSWAYMAGPTLFGGEYTAVLVRFDAEGKVRDARKVSSKTWN